MIGNSRLNPDPIIILVTSSGFEPELHGLKGRRPDRWTTMPVARLAARGKERFALYYRSPMP